MRLRASSTRCGSVRRGEFDGFFQDHSYQVNQLEEGIHPPPGYYQATYQVLLDFMRQINSKHLQHQLLTRRPSRAARTAVHSARTRL